MTEQLALDLGMVVEPPATVVSRCNEAAYALLAEWPRWPAQAVTLTGPAGAGKSHFARAFAERTGGTVVPGMALGGMDVVSLGAAPVAVDDARAADERALFHLLNAARAAGTTVLMTARGRPVPGLADLASRLRAAPEVRLHAPDDGLLRRVMTDAFARRQMPVEPAVVAYLASRIERTLHAAVDVVDAIDRACLQERKGPTRPLAARVLQAGSPPRLVVS